MTHIVDLLADGPGVTCECGNPGAWPRTYLAPTQDGRAVRQAGGWFCDPCEALARTALSLLGTGRDPWAALATIGRAGRAVA